MTIPNPYPTLPGLTYSVIKRAVGGNTAVAKAASGREIRIGLWTYPEWEWDLMYEYLPDKQANGATVSDLKNLMGFVLFNMGGLTAFPYMDVDDSTVTGQWLGFGDGSNKNFTIIKALGVGAFNGAEPIGYLDTTFATKVYVNGVLKTLTTDYTLNTTTPYTQQVQFVTAPASSAVVTIDMRYYYMARIKDDTTEFEKFMNQLWAVKKITLASLKGT